MSDGGFVAYYRVSTGKQGASGLGLEAQREAVTQYLNGGNWKIVAEFVEIESGRKDERPQLEKALAASRLHQVPLIVAKLDRLTRKTAFLSKLLDAGVEVRFCDLPEVSGPQGRFLLHSMVNVAELEAGLISSRTKDALRAAKARGVKLGGDRGYRIKREHTKAGTEARQEKAKQRAQDLKPLLEPLMAQGASLNAMARELTQKAIPTARGGQRWSPAQVKRVVDLLSVG